MFSRGKKIVAVVLAATGMASLASSLSAATTEWHPAFSYKTEVPVELGLGVVFAGLAWEAGRGVPNHCGWCDAPAFDLRVRHALLWSKPGRAAIASDFMGAIVLPAAAVITHAAVARGGEGALFAEDAVVVGESLLAAGLLNQAAKVSIGRARPYARYGAGPAGPDDNHSFYSGHASFAFSLVCSSASVADLRGFKGRGWIWAIGLPLAAATGYLRIAGDQHYASDVLVGAAVGGFVGWIWPRLHPHESEAREKAASRP